MKRSICLILLPLICLFNIDPLHEIRLEPGHRVTCERTDASRTCKAFFAPDLENVASANCSLRAQHIYRLTSPSRECKARSGHLFVSVCEGSCERFDSWFLSSLSFYGKMSHAHTGESVAEKVISPDVIPVTDVESSSLDSDHGFDESATKKLIRKIDWNLMPVIVILYLLSFLDRTNIGNARLANLEKDLGMSVKSLDYNVRQPYTKGFLQYADTRLKIALAILYPFYVAAEIPSNIMMKLTRPSLWLPSTMVAWGIVCTLMGLCTSFGGLLGARAALGLAEGGLFPGINF